MEDLPQADPTAENDHISTTRAAYDAGAEHYAGWVGFDINAAMERPMGRLMLGAFAELVRTPGPVTDVGCGPGRADAFLEARGVEVIRIDLSWQMLLIASSAHPNVPLAQAALPLRDSPPWDCSGLAA